MVYKDKFPSLSLQVCVYKTQSWRGRQEGSGSIAIVTEANLVAMG